MTNGQDAKDMARAIRAKCIDCCGHSRILAEDCSEKNCPLWPFKPERADKPRGGSCGEQTTLFEYTEIDYGKVIANETWKSV